MVRRGFMRLPFFLSLLSICIVLSIIAYYSLNKPIEIVPGHQDGLTAQKVYRSNDGEINYTDFINDETKTCGRGKFQSPINIDAAQINEKQKGNLKITYNKVHFTVENNGYTIKANAKSKKNELIIDGDRYKFVELHFHTPSEHQLNGQYTDMEAHLVHQNKNGDLAIIGLMIQNGRENEILDSIWSAFPYEENGVVTTVQNVELSKILPEMKSVYHYEGSLTTPPCTEGVKWFIFEQPIELSNQQIEMFVNIFQQNNRPLQQLNDREILLMEISD